MKTVERNVLVLAYLGDTIYENYVRRHLIEQDIANVNDLQKEAVKYVSAKAQASFVKTMIENNFLTEDEIRIFTRIRNHKGHGHPKSCDVITYKHSTGLEGLIGYLDMTNNKERIEEIMNFIIGE